MANLTISPLLVWLFSSWVWLSVMAKGWRMSRRKKSLHRQALSASPECLFCTPAIGCFQAVKAANHYIVWSTHANIQTWGHVFCCWGSNLPPTSNITKTRSWLHGVKDPLSIHQYSLSSNTDNAIPWKEWHIHITVSCYIVHLTPTRIQNSQTNKQT